MPGPISQQRSQPHPEPGPSGRGAGGL